MAYSAFCAEHAAGKVYMIDFFSMGGYALYVWGSYGVTLAAVAIEVVLLRQRKRRIVEQLRALAQHNETGTL